MAKMRSSLLVSNREVKNVWCYSTIPLLFIHGEYRGNRTWRAQGQLYMASTGTTVHGEHRDNCTWRAQGQLYTASTGTTVNGEHRDNCTWRAQGQLYLNYTTTEKLVIPKIHHRVQINFSINCILHSPLPASVRPTFITVIPSVSNFFKHLLRANVCRKIYARVANFSRTSYMLRSCIYYTNFIKKNNKLETIHCAVFSRLILLPLSPRTSFFSPLFRTNFQPLFVPSYETPNVSLLQNNK